MQRRCRPSWPLIAAWLLTQAACSSGSTDCTCSVDLNGERRTLVCGQSACIAGMTVSCTDKNTTAQRGACTAPPAEPPAEPGNLPQPPAVGDDRSCSDLRDFCSVGCAAPALVSADCQATASLGDPAACRAWQLTNSVACHP